MYVTGLEGQVYKGYLISERLMVYRKLYMTEFINPIL